MTITKMSRRAAGQTLLAATASLFAPRAFAQSGEVKLGLLVPLSGIYARAGEVMRKGAELAIDHINAQGGVASLGGKKITLVVLDSGDTIEKAKNAAQRMVSQETDLVAASGAYLSSFTLAMTEVTERAKLPVTTVAYSDLITARGFKYVFQTSATAVSQAENSLPALVKLAESASGKRPKTMAIVMDNTAASVSFVKPIKERLLAELGIKLVVDETFTPPLTDATPMIQKVRAAKPDLFLLMPTVLSDAKLLIEKMNEFGIGRGRIPTISSGTAMAEPDLLGTIKADYLEGLMTVVANWNVKGQEKLNAEYVAKSGEPWMTQSAINAYGEMWLHKAALEKAGKVDREAVAEALRTLDLTDGAAKYFAGGRVKFDDKGRRIGAGLYIAQWQGGKAIAVYPDDIALAQPIWPKT